MVAAETKTCRSCGAEIIWTRTHKGKRMPVDKEPVGNGNIMLRVEADGTVIAEYPGHEAPQIFDVGDDPRYVSHFATCDHANEWRDMARNS